jgi:hypothetical protein
MNNRSKRQSHLSDRKNRRESATSSVSELFFGVAFLIIGVVDVFQANAEFAIGFFALGAGIILSTTFVHDLLHVDSQGAFTPLRIVSYLLALIAITAFAIPFFGLFG